MRVSNVIEIGYLWCVRGGTNEQELRPRIEPGKIEYAVQSLFGRVS